MASAATGVTAALGGVRQALAQRREEQVATVLKRERRPPLTVETDPQRLNEYLFNSAGRLSLHEYVADAEARNVVESAISRVDELLTGSHLAQAQAALDRGDVVSALARLRLEIELRLRALAALSDVAESETSGGAALLVRLLSRAGVLATSQAESLSQAIRVANGALHGETVTRDDASEVLAAASRALEEIDAQHRRARR